MRIFSPFKALVELWSRYERPLSAGSLIIGFTFDLFVAKRPDSVTDNIILLSYLFIAGAFIIILNIHINRRGQGEVHTATPIILLLILQFCFGGLASNLLVLYGKSGTFAGSALFFVLLGGMLVGNEFMQTRYAQLRFNIVVYYFLMLTYCVIAVPTFIFHSVGKWIFLASGGISLAAIGVFLSLVYVVVLRGREREAQLYEVSVLVGLVFLLFNGLYFLQIIPPVPLSLKSIGVYHSLTRLPADAGGAQSIYSATYEPAPWYEFWRATNATYTVFASQRATCFSSVFAPTNLSAPIYHRWEEYDETQNKWLTVSRISFDISGGRADGYRGFTLVDVAPGRWRCDVETENGALIGRTTFTVVSASSTPALSQTTL